MLHWQLKKWLSGWPLKAKVFFASTFAHLCILFSLFILYRGNEQYHILVTGTMINTDVPIVFLPMHKSLKQGGGISSKSSNLSDSSKIGKTTAITSAKKGTIATAFPEQKSKKTSSKKKIQEAKKKTKKETLRQAQGERKLDEPKKILEPVRAEALEASQPIQVIPLEVACPPKLIGEGRDNSDVLYVGQQEMQALQMQEYIQQEMAQHWSAPPGMRKDISCTIKVAIGFDGNIRALDVERSSGVMIFDDAAKRAASQLTPPAWAYGKEIVLTFKP